MVKINKFQPNVCYLYSPNGDCIGEITNEEELNDVRIQIAEQELGKYYIEFNNLIINISNSGDLDNWAKGFYDTSQKQFAELVRIKKSRLKK